MRGERIVAAFCGLGALLFVAGAASGIDTLDARWIHGLLPEPLLHPGPFGLLRWQWLALPALTLLAFALGRLLGHVSRVVLRGLFKRTATVWDDELLREITPALSLVWSLLVADALLPALALKPAVFDAARSLLAAGLSVAIAWTLWRSVFVLCQLLLERPGMAGNPSARSLVGVGAVIAKILIWVIGIFTVAAAFGYKLDTALAGLGIGGIAVALGAQKMIENLFGSLSLGIDQPFHLDDLVTVDAVTGTVERIGFRSTRIRTADRTLVSIPNGKLADMRIETMAARDRRRFALTLSLDHSSSSAQATRFIDGVKRVLGSHPYVWPGQIIVSLADVDLYGWDIEIVVWFQTIDDSEFRNYREEVLLAVMEVVQQAGVSLAWRPRHDAVV